MDFATFLQSLGQALMVGFSNVVAGLIAFLPRLLGALVILVIGVWVGNWLKKAFIGLISRSNLSEMAKRSRLGDLFKQVQLQFKPEEILGEILRWFVIIVFAISAINVLGLTTVSQVLTQILAYLPKVVSALIIFVAGVILAGFVENFVKRAFVELDAPTARLLAKASSYAVVVLTSLIALSELGLATSFIQILFAGVVGSFALAFGLAFGLGSKDLIRRILETWYNGLKR